MFESRFGQKRVSLETVIDNLLSAVVVLRRDTTIVMANKMAAFIADKTKDEMCNLRGGEAFRCINADKTGGCGSSPECEFCEIRKAVEKSFSEKRNENFREGALDIRGVGQRNFRFTTTYLSREDLVVLAIDDITEMKLLEAERLHNDRLQGAMMTAGAICHEMNQPLQVLMGYLEIMAANKQNNSPCNEQQINTMRLKVKQLAGITRKLQNIRRYAEKDYVEGTPILDIEKSTAAV